MTATLADAIAAAAAEYGGTVHDVNPHPVTGRYNDPTPRYGGTA